MGTTPLAPSEALFTKTQRRILGLLFGSADRTHYANEIVRSARVGIGAAMRELARLEAAGLVVVARIGNQKHFQANRRSPVFEELASLARKLLAEDASTGLAPTPVSLAREPHAAYEVAPVAVVPVSRSDIARLCRKYGVRKLSLFGSAARRELESTSDIDLMVEFRPDSKATLFDFPAIQKEFSALFGNRSVDLVPPEVLRNPHRRKTILPDLQVLYEAR
jgi:predicted nucleotidyltransferase